MHGILILGLALMPLVQYAGPTVTLEATLGGVGERLAASPVSTPQAFARPSGVQQEQEPVDINRATATQLQQVPGIGPAMATRILEWRRDNGPFERVEDLLNVRGIGPKVLEKLRPYVVVRPADARSQR